MEPEKSGDDHNSNYHDGGRDDDTAGEMGDEAMDLFDEGCYEQVKEVGDVEDWEELTSTILSEKEIFERMENAVSTVTSCLQVNRAVAGTLLRKLNWSPSTVKERWFAEEPNLRESVGLGENSSLTPSIAMGEDFDLVTEKCGQCSQLLPLALMVRVPVCGHFTCEDCWTGYVHEAILSGPDCLSLRCPQNFCNAVVEEELILRFADGNDRPTYQRYQTRDYVDSNRKAKWCPAPGCKYAIECSELRVSSTQEIFCKCGKKFCWNCLGDAHRPLSCKSFAHWKSIVQEGYELLYWCKECDWPDNLNWLLDNRKPCPSCGRYKAWRDVLFYIKRCPSCRRPIQRDEGCVHMSCPAPCGYAFCWRCLGPWEKHKSQFCSNPEDATVAGKNLTIDYDDVRHSPKLEPRFETHFKEWVAYEREYHKVSSFAEQELNHEIERLSYILARSTLEFQFLRDAWRQIADCQLKLKWMCTYGYYIPGQRFTTLQESAKELEKKLREAEKCCSRVAEADPNSFLDCKGDLITLTVLTKTQFQKIAHTETDGGFLYNNIEK
ncbi:hypothetical protein R1flu_009571 [Riccia fluitans]|uniref:RBR-type E3 ubiquitin transferase n=1 Tax=Riccia fluitans TaxID=41844 RepID=A0ABD1Z2G8_9MARC